MRTGTEKSKFLRLKPQEKPIILSYTVKNLSNFQLDEAQVSVLAKGHNFAITPKRIPIEEIISQTETAIFHLPPETGNDIRNKITNILHKAKLPKTNISKEENLALRRLKENNNIIILPADKGNATVVMDRRDYSEKIKSMLNDPKTYKKLNKDPTSSIKTKTTALLKKANLSLELMKSLTPKESSPPRLYGLPKIHKESIPLRPIVSNIGSPTYQLARYLTKPLQKLTGKNTSFIQNSLDFVNKLTTLRTSPQDIMVSFDVESLFTNVPITDTLKIIENNQDFPRPLLPLIEHCLKSTYFLFEGEFHEQKSGAAMGSPVSPIIANIFMEHFENEVLRTAKIKPTTWYRYVDDTFVIWPHGKTALDQFLEYLNTRHPSIRFTMEVEKDRCLPFLDVLIRRNENGTLGHQVYRKPTHTDRYLHATSHHHASQKNSVISSLMHRALTISHPSTLDNEMEHLETTLSNNGYNKHQIRRVRHKLEKKITSPQDNITPEDSAEKPRTALLPYLQGTSDRIGRILRKHNIRTIFQPPKKIGQILTSAKDQRPPLSTPGVYKIPCECGKVYIGETGRKISTRIKEHQRSSRYGHWQQSALAEHHMTTGHTIQFDQSKMLASSQGYFARKYREGLEIHKHSNNLNRDKGYEVSHTWKAILPVF